MRSQLLPLALLLVAPALAQDPCDEVSILQVQYAAVDPGLVEVIVHNQSGELFDYPSFALVDDQGDTLAREVVNFFGIGPTPQAHYLSVLPGATLPTGAFDGTLLLSSAFGDSVSCTFDLSGIDLCPPPPCQQAIIYLTNLDVPETFAAYWWIDGDEGTFLYSGTFLMDGITAMGFDTLCLPPGDYVLNFTPFSPIDTTYVAGITSDWNFTIGTNTYLQGDNSPLDLAFTWYVECAEISNAVAEPVREDIHAYLSGDQLLIGDPNGQALGTVMLFGADGRLLLSSSANASRTALSVARFASGIHVLQVQRPNGERFATRIHIP